MSQREALRRHSSITPSTSRKGVASSSVGPGLAMFHNALFAAGKHVQSDQRIWFPQFHAVSWAQPQDAGFSPEVMAVDMYSES